MTRLIDAEKLKKHYAWWEDDERRHLFDQIVDAQPTVDAVPVRHGKWESLTFTNASNEEYTMHRCSECGLTIVTGWYHYCPNCGARMDKDV